MSNSTTQKKVWISIAVIVLLFIMFVINTFAFISSFISSEANLFETAKVDIDFNGNRPVFVEDDFFLEPGRERIQPFYLRNNSTVDVYYRLYMDDFVGALKDALVVRIYDKDHNCLFTANMTDLTRETPFVDTAVLKVGETKELYAGVLMKTGVGNAYQNEMVSFSMYADATQVKNNFNKDFDD